MATNPDGLSISAASGVEGSRATVEIKIKTLDSQTYTLRVDRCVPVPTLKEQIATVTGVLSEQQRLICHGKVLKDDQLLSAYHVEDGHTLHLVVRQPFHSSSTSATNTAGSNIASGISGADSIQNRFSRSVMVGTFNLSEQGNSTVPDMHRLLSDVLSSVGIVGSVSEGAGNEYSLERLGQLPGSSSLTDVAHSQSNQVPSSEVVAHQLATAPFAPYQILLPDSLATLSWYLRRLLSEFSASGDQVEGYVEELHTDLEHGPIRTPSSLAEVMHSTRHLLIEQVSGYLSQIARQLEDEANVTSGPAREHIQAATMRSGVLLQNLAALLLELGRAAMTLRMGRTSSEALVNAGPAVFISQNGPNPLMVQPFPFAPRTNVAVGGSHGLPGGPFSSGFFPRNIDIRIRSGPSASTSIGEHTVVAEQSTQIGHASDSSAEERSSTVGSEGEVRVRTVVAAVPVQMNNTPNLGNAGVRAAMFCPVVARFQPARTARSSQGGNFSQSGDFDSLNAFQTVAGAADSLNAEVIEQQGHLPPNDRRSEMLQPRRNLTEPESEQQPDLQMSSRFNQLLDTIFPGDPPHVTSADVILATPDDTGAIQDQMQEGSTSEEAYAHGGAPGTGDDGIFLSNLLRQIIPQLSQTTEIMAEPGRNDNMFMPQNSSGDGHSHHRDSLNPPDAKRQKLE